MKRNQAKSGEGTDRETAGKPRECAVLEAKRKTCFQEKRVKAMSNEADGSDQTVTQSNHRATTGGLA